MGKKRIHASSALAAATPGTVVAFRPKALGPPEGSARLAEMAEVGVSGTTNQNGALFVETNSKLRGSRGYGTPGVHAWGEWERLARTDSAVAAALDLVVAPLRDADVNVEAATDGNPLAQQHADYVRKNLNEWLEPLWPEVIQQMARGELTYGFSLHETVLAQGKDTLLPSGDGFRLAKLAQRLPATVEPNGWIERDGELVEIRQRGIKDGTYLSNVVLPAEKTLLVSWNREGNNYQGFSAFRPVWYLCKVREHLLKIVGIGHQREALGVPMATMDRDAPLNERQRKSLQKILANLVYHENASIVLPPGVKLEWFNSPGATKGHVLEAWRQLGIAIMEVLQAQQMALGTSDTGARAVGQVHDNAKGTFIQGVKASLEAVFNGVGRRPYTGLGRKIIEPNWGQQSSYPRITLSLPTTSLPPSEFVAAAAAAVGARMLTWSGADENRLRIALGLPTRSLEVRSASIESLPGPAVTVSPSPALSPLAGIGSAPAGRPTPVPAGATALRPTQFAAAGPVVPATWVPRRELFAHEKDVAWGELDALLSGAKDSFDADMKPLLVAALAKALPAVKDAMADGDPSELINLQLDFGPAESLIAEFLEHVRAEGKRHVQAESKKPVEQVAEERQDAAAIASEEPKGPVTFARKKKTKVPFDADKLIKSQRALLVQRMRARTLDSLTRAAIEKVRTGGAMEDIVTDVISDTLEANSLRRDAGGVVAQVVNIGREEFAREHGDDIRVVRLSALLDAGTCSYCERLDGAEFEFGSAEHDEHVPPLRECEGKDNCRCVLVYDFVEGASLPTEEEPADPGEGEEE